MCSIIGTPPTLRTSIFSATPPANKIPLTTPPTSAAPAVSQLIICYEISIPNVLLCYNQVGFIVV